MTDEFDLTGWDKPRDLFHAAEPVQGDPVSSRYPASKNQDFAASGSLMSSNRHSTDDGKLFELRPRQVRALDMLRDAIRAGRKRIMMQAPVSFGKTILAAHMTTGALGKNNRVAMTVPALSLVDQTVEKFVANGIGLGDIGVYQGDHELRRAHAPCQVCSVQTVAARGFPLTNLVLVDEAHLQYAIIDEWMADDPSRIFVGLSGTPWARGMAEKWDCLLIPATIRELIREGWMSDFTIYAPSHPDLKGVKMAGDDYQQTQLSARMQQPTLVADIVQNWATHDKCPREKTFCYGVDRAHAQMITDQFQTVGINAAYIDGDMDRDDRNSIMKRYRTGEHPVVVSVGTMIMGVDEDVRCIINGCPTKSEIKWVQLCGRGLRLAEGKDRLILYDHSDTALNLGTPAEIHHETLRSGKPNASEKEAKPTKLRLPKECPQCTALVPVGERVCPGCGHELKVISGVITEEGELEELGAAKKARKSNKDWTWEEKAAFFGEMKSYAIERGYKEGFAAQKYRARFLVWPNDPRVKYAPARAISMETRGWLRSQQIRYAKSQKASTSEGFMRVERALR